MSNDYPVRIESISPPHFDRAQLLLRIGVAVVLAWLGLTAGWLVCLLFAALPLIAALAISSAGGAGYLNEVAPPVTEMVMLRTVSPLQLVYVVTSVILMSEALRRRARDRADAASRVVRTWA